MDAVLIEFLWGLYFIGVSLPSLFDSPIPRSSIIQALFGLALFILAFFQIPLVH